MVVGHLRTAAVLTAIAAAAVGGSGASAEATATATVPLPSTGNVSVTRLAVERTSASSAGTPRVSLAGGQGVPATTFVVSLAAPSGGPGRYQVTIAAIDTGTPAQAPTAGKTLVLNLAAGFRLGSPPRSVKDVLYRNTVPAFRLVTTGAAQVVAGRVPGKLPTARMVRDAQLLALERSVPLADMQLIGLQYVAVQVPARPSRTFSVAIGLSRLNQVNAVELRFPAGITVVRASAPERVSTLPRGTAVQFVASAGFFDEGLQYGFQIELSRAPKSGDAILVRASEHYFESVLPLRERFVLP